MKQFFKWTGYLLLFITILIFIGLLTWDSVSYFLVGKVAQFYASKADIVLDIDKISGKPFSETTVENISVRPAGEKPQAYYFKSQSITCTYNLWDLQKGYEFFLQGFSCKADLPEYFHDFSKSSLQEKTGTERQTFLLPAVLPRLDVYSGAVILTDEGWDIDLHGINAGLRTAASTHELRLEVERLSFSQEGLTRIDSGFTSLLRYAEDKLTVDPLEIGQKGISAAGVIDLSRLHEEHLEFAADVAFAQSQLVLTGSWTDRLLRTHVGTDSFDIAELLKRLGGPGWDVSGRVRGEADLAVNLETLEQLDGTFSLSVLDGKVRSVRVEKVAAAGSFDNGILKVSSAEAGTSGNHITVSEASLPIMEFGRGNVLSALARSQARFKADINEMASLLDLVGLETVEIPDAFRPKSLKISGSLAQGSVQVDNGRAETDDAILTIVRGTMPIPATGQPFESLPIDIDARYEVADLADLADFFGDKPLSGQATADISITGNFKEMEVGISLSGEYLSFGEMQLGSIALQGNADILQESPGKINSARFSIVELRQQNGSGTLALLTPAKGTWQQDMFSADAVFQVDGKGEVLIGIKMGAGSDLSGEITVHNLESSGFLENFISTGYFFSGADLEAVFRGIPQEPQLQLNGTLSKLGGAGVPIPMSGSFNLQYNSKGLEITEFAWKSLERNQLTISGFLPYDPLAPEPLLEGALVLEANVDFPALEDIAFLLEPWGIGKGSVAVDIDLTGSWKEPEGRVVLQVEGVEPPDRLRNLIESPVNLTCEIEAKKKSIILKSATLDSEQYSARATGSWLHGVTVRQVLQKRKAELQGDIAVDAAVQLKDLNFLRRNLTWLRRLEGDMRGEIHLAGPVTGPTFKGSFSLKDGEASHTFNFPILTAINLAGDFDERSISITDMRAEVGGSPVNLNGKVAADQGKVDVNLQISGSNLLLFRNNDMRLRGDVELDVSGPLERLTVKGTTGLTSGYYTRNLDLLGMIGSSSIPVSEGVGFLFSFTEPPLRDAVLDIRITSIEPFRVRNNVIRGALRPELTLRGTGELPYLVGTVYIDPSRVILPSGRLQVQSGLLRFLEGEPDRPQLDLLAQSKILGYDINVVIKGPLDDPVVTLSSSPSLPNEDLLLLLLTGQPPREDATESLKDRGTTNVMVYLGRDFLNKWLEDESGAGDETILDRFELDFGRDVTKSGEQTIESSFRLSKDTTGTRKVFYLVGEKDKYDAYNYGLRLVFRFE